MKNPYYEGEAPEPEKRKEIDVATDRVREYMQAAPNVEEFDVAKLRRLHPALEDDATWTKVRKTLEEGTADRAERGREREDR